ncbi:MAG: FAD:protein FMN transferase [Sulfurimonas sp.]
MYLYQFEAFTTPCELHIEAICNTSADSAAKTVMTYAKQLEYSYGFFRKTSDVYAINHRSKNSHIISDEFAGLIKMALFYNKVTCGIFDIALSGTLKASLNSSSLEEYQQHRNELLPFASCEHISLEGNCLSFSNAFTKIDLGGLVKEYAVDQAVLQLQNLGIKSALINFGGDIAAYGTCHGNPWKIGIQNPDDIDSNLIEVALNDGSVCTSGHSKRYTTIENENITHIISASQSYASSTQISVVAPTTLDAGIWSTVLLIKQDLILPAHIQLVHNV